MKSFRMQATTLLAGGLLALGLIALPATSSEAASCKQACTKFRTCLVDYWGKRGKTATEKQKRTAYLGCMKTCNKHKAKVLKCYASSKNSCPAYWACVRKNYSK